MKKLLPIFIIAMLIVGGGAFYGGMKYAQNTRQNLPRRELGGQMFGNRQRVAGGFTAGEIMSKDGQTVIIRHPDGGSKIIFYSDATEIGKFVDGSVDDLEVGKNISVNGSANPDGSVTAQSIQLRTLK